MPTLPSSLEFLHPRSLKHLSGHLRSLVEGRLWLKVLLGMVGGTAFGIAIGPSAGWLAPEIAASVGDWVAVPGRVFLALIQMIVVPLVFASIIRGLAASEDIEHLRRLGLQSVVFFVITTALAIVLGISLALWIEPGSFLDPAEMRGLASGAGAAAPAFETLDDQPLPDRLVSLLPANPLGALVNADMLQVVLFAVVIGVALVSLAAAQAKPLLDLLGSLQQVCMAVVSGAMRLAPIAVFGLMAQLTAKVGLDALLGLGVYVGTVLLGLLGVLALLLIAAFLFAGRRPLPLLRALREVQLLAFSTSSSAAVMPLSIKTAEEKLGVRPSTAQFVIPLGATINMNGTALYQGVAAVFLAQVFGIELGPGALTLLVVTAVASSIGSPATPGVGIVILATVLTSVGVPTAGIGLLMGVDRLLDMSRSAVNVTGDLVAAVILDHRIGGVRSAEEQLAAEAAREATRTASGEDVIVVDRHSEDGGVTAA